MGSSAIRLRVLWDKLQRNLDDYGWSVTLRKGFAYLFSPIYLHQIYRLYRITLDRTEPRGDFDRHGFTFRVLTSQDGHAVSQVENAVEWLRGELSERISAGELCLVALSGEEVVGVNLVNFSQMLMPLVMLEKGLRRGTAWSEHIAVRKEFRRMGLACRLRYRLFDELKRRGIRKLYGGRLLSNLAAAKLEKSVGFKAIVDIDYRRILRLQIRQYKRVRS
jgi:GNAT superfamily N-acetyltransferase